MKLGDSALVLRGGLPDEDRWFESVLDAMDEGHPPVLSVFGGNQHETEDQTELIWRIAVDADVKHGKIAVATVGEVRKLGLQFQHDPSQGQSDNHFHIVFPKEPSIIMVRDLISVFSAPFPNPRR